MKKLFILFIVATFSVVGYSQNYQNYHFDVNGDGVVTAADVTSLYDYLLGNIFVPEYVDLGLPSGTLWAKTNVGATKPEETGDYFAWGETTPKDTYFFDTYKWCMGSINTLTKYCTNSSNGYNGFTDGKTELVPEDDAATANWGSEWCMPTKAQQDELLAECTWQWTTINGVKGYLLTSKHNGASLFLPAVGYLRFELYYSGMYGHYWSRTLGSSNQNTAYRLIFGLTGEIGVNDDADLRCLGLSVRAVRVSQK